jgi:hypothetical protein
VYLSLRLASQINLLIEDSDKPDRFMSLGASRVGVQVIHNKKGKYFLLTIKMKNWEMPI